MFIIRWANTHFPLSKYPFIVHNKEIRTKFMNAVLRLLLLTFNRHFLKRIMLKIASATKRWLLKMCHLRHWLRNFCIFQKLMFRSQDIKVFVFSHPMIYQICDVLTSTRDRVHSNISFEQLLSHQTWPTDISKGNNFQKFFEQPGGLGLSFRSISI